MDGAHQRCTFNQFIASAGKEASFGDGSAPVSGTAYALQGPGYGAGRADVADKIDMADINAQLQGCSGNQYLDLIVLELAFGLEAQLARQTAMMGSHCIFTKALGKIESYALGQPAGVDEHQRGAVLLHQLADAVINLIPHLMRGHWAKLHSRN